MVNAEPSIWNVDHKPCPQPRIRATRRGVIYTPPGANAWRAAVVAAGEAVRPTAPLAGPVRVAVSLRMARPISATAKSRRHERPIRQGTGDLDNHAKSVLDALTRAGWWLDDAQVVELVVTKRWTLGAELPGATISVASV